ncbi:hypothetical protein STG2_105 [Salmonella phage STG2]|uniref:Uncharacterized protein n=1 Tax=Salmonella phage STG2 TaxID=2480623 RepID=A0A3G2KAV3_9CAUD|nr:hypothetical protein HOU44_gp130 [Salmonella phage STG2]AYN56069.1 hypothetical protein STG2_105 [Salmonella phage STG2]
MKTSNELKEEAKVFVNGFIAGSCNSFDYSLTVFTEEHPEVNKDILETILNKAIEEAEIFLCDSCGWWCWAHERSWNDYDTCRDCDPEEEED